MLIRANFGQLDGLTEQMLGTIGRVQQEMDAWAAMAGATTEDWLDNAGGEFEGVNAAWKQVAEAQREMLAALRGAVQVANDEMRQALEAARARVASTAV
jgi:uncharacterized protein YukE